MHKTFLKGLLQLVTSAGVTLPSHYYNLFTKNRPQIPVLPNVRDPSQWVARAQVGFFW